MVQKYGPNHNLLKNKMKYQNRGERNEAVIIISYNVAYDIDSVWQWE